MLKISILATLLPVHVFAAHSLIGQVCYSDSQCLEDHWEYCVKNQSLID